MYQNKSTIDRNSHTSGRGAGRSVYDPINDEWSTEFEAPLVAEGEATTPSSAGTPESPRFIDLFAGIGGIRLAFQRAGGTCVFSSEVDPQARKTYSAYFGDEPWGDITGIDAAVIPDHDILAAGFPCPDFSAIGGKRGLDGNSGQLFFEIVRILEAKRPASFLLENVKGLVSRAGGSVLDEIRAALTRIGYRVQYRVLDARSFGLPQRRERIVFVGFRDDVVFQWPTPQRSRLVLSDVLEPDVDVAPERVANAAVCARVAGALAGKKLPSKPWICHTSMSGNVVARPYSCALRAEASTNYLLVNGIRRLTGREMLRLQGFPEDFPIIVSHPAITRQCGNSVPVPMIEAVARQVVLALSGATEPVGRDPRLWVTATASS